MYRTSRQVSNRPSDYQRELAELKWMIERNKPGEENKKDKEMTVKFVKDFIKFCNKPPCYKPY